MELHSALGELDRASEYAERALTIFRALRDHWGTSAVQYHLGLALHRAGRVEEAMAVYEAALAEGREVGLANTVQYLLANMGHIALLLGDNERAERHFAEARVVAQQLGAQGNPLASLGEGLLARQRGDLGAARRHYSEAIQALSGPSTRDWAAAAMTGLGFVSELAGDLDEAEACHRRAWHAALEAGDVGAASGACALEGLACVAAARGDGKTAATLLGAAAQWRMQKRRAASVLETQDTGRAMAQARALLGAETYEALFSAVSPDTADLLV
jgi:tetratricopeptide (TPR) repeat protein